VSARCLLWALALALAAPTAAEAGRKHGSKPGALSRVVGGLRAKTGSHSRPTRSPDKNNDSADESESDDDDSFDEDFDGGDGAAWSIAPASLAAGLTLGVRAPSGNVDSDFQLGLQILRDSDAAVTGEARFAYGTFVLSVASATYMETLPNDDLLTLSTWRGTAGYRMVTPGMGSLSFEAGPTGTYADGVNLIGLVAGVSARGAIRNLLGVDAAARAYAYTDDVSALEVSAGVRLSVIRLGYRVMKFNVGPPLHGPEFGMAFSF